MKMLLNQCLIGLSRHCNIFKRPEAIEFTKHLGPMITMLFVRKSQVVSEPVNREITGHLVCVVIITSGTCRSNPLYIVSMLC
jgi:hypothetical protein